MSAMPQIAPITEIRNTHTGVLSKLKNGPVFLTQRGTSAAVLLSPTQWERLNQRVDELETMVDILQSKVELLSGQATYEEVTFAELEAATDAIPS
jgi:prevent-host-death family protein